MKTNEIDELARWACLQENIAGVLDLYEAQDEIYRRLRDTLINRDLDRVARGLGLRMSFDDALIATGRGSLRFFPADKPEGSFYVCFSFDKSIVYGISCNERYKGIPMEQIYDNESDEFWPYGWSYLHIENTQTNEIEEADPITTPAAMRAISDGRLAKAIEDALHDVIAGNLLERLDN